jgi:hypothetical protein
MRITVHEILVQLVGTISFYMQEQSLIPKHSTYSFYAWIFKLLDYISDNFFMRITKIMRINLLPLYMIKNGMINLCLFINSKM